MKNSNFVNASGWPDPGHETTARDLSKLAIATIKNFPDFYHYYGEKTFTYNGIKQGNRNPTIYRNIGADGLKTGHTEAGGYSARIDGTPYKPNERTEGLMCAPNRESWDEIRDFMMRD